MKWILLAHVASTWAMFGLIWFVQIVHYPLFDGVGDNEFPSYEKRHCRLTTWVVAPLMLTELATAIWLCLVRSSGQSSVLTWLGLGLVVLIWISTAVLQVPAHDNLSEAFSSDQHTRLVATNWLRTVAWSLRGVIALLMLIPLLKL